MYCVSMLLRQVTIFSTIIFVLISGLFLIVAWNVGDAMYFAPTMHVTQFDTSEITAKSFAVFDEASGTIIAAKNDDTVLPIASVTKLITASVFYGHTNAAATTSITWSDIAAEGNAGNLQPHEVFTYRELLYPLLLESSNDAAVVMLRVDSSLLTDMHTFILSLGLQKTVFKDTSGLSAQNVSTVSELVTIADTLYKKDQYIFDITRLHQFVGTYTGWINNNPLINMKGYAGGKHGYTPEADRTVVAFFDEHLTTGQIKTIGYVLLGSDNLASDIALLRTQVEQNVTIE